MNMTFTSARLNWFSVPITLGLSIVLLFDSWPATAGGRIPPDVQARRILDETGVKGGLVVHVGCGEGRLTAELRVNDSYLVHGLDANPANVSRARTYIQSLGLDGRVSVDLWNGRQLPYTANLVNLLISEQPMRVPVEEVIRVLVPGGVAYILEAGARWTKTVKPWPDDMDEWTHFLHDASNNAVARDMQVGPPRRLRWVCEPVWSRSHEFISSLCAMVSAKGRLFYIVDEGLTGVTADPLPERWMLTARDAFNGVLLWSRHMPKWGSRAWKKTALRSAPLTVPRRLVAADDRVFVTLGYGAPISVLDAATGEVLTTYQGTEGTEEIRFLDGVLTFRKGSGSVVAIDTKSGKKLWETSGDIRPLSLAAHDGKVFYQSGKTLVCVGMRDGTPLWHTPNRPPVSVLVVHGDRILALSKQTLEALAADTGKPLWSVNTGAHRAELFVANNQVWHWENEHIVGRDLSSGEVATRLDTDDVFTPGHHLRCYQSKATEQFLITPNRGAEFVSLTGADHTQNDWVRGSCRYGIMPCNGLLYAPPHPCFCYPGVKLTGFNALAPAAGKTGQTDQRSRGQRLDRGPAFVKIANPQSAIRNTQYGDWPTYRHDARRSGATVAEVPARLATQWKVRLQGRLTPPVAVRDRVYVAAKDEHTIYAFHIEDGSKLWQYTAGGRIDSPPTVYGDLVLFGCADGRIYCLRTSDGELVWRFRAAPSDHLIVAFGQLESPWRVHGSVLVKDGTVYCTAGRSTYLDGGIWIFGLDPTTGTVVYETNLDTWARTRKDAENKPFVPGYHMEGACSDILVSEGDYIYLGQYKFDRTLTEQRVPYIVPGPDDTTVAMDLAEQPFVAEDMEPEKDYEDHQRKWLERKQQQLLESLMRTYGGYSLGDRHIGLHVFSTSGFLDDSWFNRTFWMYAATWPGYYIAHRGAKTGQLLVVGPQNTYAVQAYTSRNLQSPLFTPGRKGYLLFADKNDNEPVLDSRTRGTTKGWGFTRRDAPVWHDWVPVRVRAMVLAGSTLFVAGPPDVVDSTDPMAAFEGRRGSILWPVSTEDGSRLAEYTLDSPPVFDGMIASNGRLYVSLENGTILCMGGEQGHGMTEKPPNRGRL